MMFTFESYNCPTQNGRLKRHFYSHFQGFNMQLGGITISPDVCSMHSSKYVILAYDVGLACIELEDELTRLAYNAM